MLTAACKIMHWQTSSNWYSCTLLGYKFTGKQIKASRQFACLFLLKRQAAKRVFNQVLNVALSAYRWGSSTQSSVLLFPFKFRASLCCSTNILHLVLITKPSHGIILTGLNTALAHMFLSFVDLIFVRAYRAEKLRRCSACLLQTHFPVRTWH